MKRQGGEMSRKSRRKPRLYPVFDPLLQSCSEHSDSHLYPKPWNRKEMKPLLAVKLPCHNHRRTKGLTACRVYISYSNSSLSTLYVAAIVMARPLFILTCTSTINVSACAANVWSQTALHSCEDNFRMRAAEREGGGAGWQTSA